jgi:hypothetical protein
MGGCQGRYCGTILADVSNQRSGGTVGEFSLFSPAAPIKPTRIGAIAVDVDEAAKTPRAF